MKKQAVVLIHGVGEQVPMDTLRGFVRAVWSTDSLVRKTPHANTVWSKPDNVSKNYELRRLTTGENQRGQRTDFFEFYWADLMKGTQLSHVWAWLRVLLLRWPWRVPAQLRGVWFTLVFLGLFIGAVWANHAAGWFPEPENFTKWVSIIGGLVWVVISGFLINYAGDAARYLHIAPVNIEGRRKIREAGIQLLESLHASGNYDRIIVVGHSLGTVIGYDILTHLWTKYHDHSKANSTTEPLPEMRALETEATSTVNFTTAKYQALQAACLSELQSRGNGWLVTDFVTMGSPLAHASLLLAQNAEKLSEKIDQRELPSCPPSLEKSAKALRFSYANKAGVWIPHHAAVFAPTRWTNLYSPCHATLWGDVIGGPIAPMLGQGIKDVSVKITRGFGIFTHTAYWDISKGFKDGQTPPQYIKDLREALGI